MMRTVEKVSVKKSFTIKLIMAGLGISLLMFIDNAWEIKTAWSTESISIYYLFFNAIVFSGMMSSYLLPVLCCLPWNIKTVKSRNNNRSKVAKEKTWNFVMAVVSSGTAVCLGYAFFIGIFSLKFPFASDDVIEAGMTIFPYVSYSLSGYTGLHLFIILLNGFLLGALYGGISITVALFTSNESVVILIPLMIRFLWIQLYRLFPVDYDVRIDYWLFMRTACSEELQTPLFAILRVTLILFVFGMMYLLKSRQEAN